MIYLAGQVLFGEIEFLDGTKPAYNRPYLIVDVDMKAGELKILNVSSIKGKEHKLSFKTNYEIKLYNPPFPIPSFVKLDSLKTISYNEVNKLKLMCGGKSLNNLEILNIKHMI